MADEQQKSTASVGAERPLTDKELEAILRESDKVTEFPEVTFDEFTPPTKEEWIEACNLLLKGKPFDKVMYTKNYEGITFDPIYTRRSTDAILPTDDYPGMGDYLRGSTANGYVGHPWGIAQGCDETMPAENNELLKEEVSKGSTVYNIKLDSATMAGVDVKDAEKPGDIGVSITTAEDMSVLLRGLDFDKYPIMMYTGASAKAILAMTAAALKAEGKDIKSLRGVIGADPIGELSKTGKTAASISTLMDEMAETVKYARANAPGLRTIFVRSTIYANGGASAVQEVAYTFATAVEYIRAMQRRGIGISDIAKSLNFCFNQGANFFMEIAKLRAAREVWACIMAAFGAEEADRAIVVHGRAGRFTKSVVDPYVNMLRNTTQMFSGVVGGVDTYENPTFDELIRKGDVFSRRIARNLHVMLQEEFGMMCPIDAAGGSWAVETLTKQMAEKVWAAFQKIEEEGGMLKALESGYPQKEVGEILAKRFKALEMRSDRAVGVNMYPNMTEVPLERRPEDTPKLKKEREAAVAAYVADIDTNVLAGKLANVATVEGAIDAFSNGATLNQVIAAGRKAEATETCEAIVPHHWTERYEALRFDTENYVKKTGKNVEVFLANMGPIPQHKARADFSTSFLQVGEFNVHLNNGFQDGEDGTAYDKCVAAAKAGCESGPYDVAVICSTDATYPDIVPALAPRLKEAMPNATIFLAGAAPKDKEPIYRAAGIDDFISVKANCYQTLKMLQKKKGMIE